MAVAVFLVYNIQLLQTKTLPKVILLVKVLIAFTILLCSFITLIITFTLMQIAYFLLKPRRNLDMIVKAKL